MSAALPCAKLLPTGAITANDVEATKAQSLAHLKMLESMREDIFSRHGDFFEQPIPPNKQP
ncbi:hypothetical protein N825_22925 [Skermanella stibiiresistens SB22]|uniref:Uncharacterized protein n=1 Tax=Skermanella stibiiresistens SB22 TaxID=1385369 RepID=W9GT64_9PROT|nr:hypothetical protein [Skermanella stibiiresistens]EWY36969.1 hypothetical protein N825_22925 [Skermanella stibiiresistens SB22]